MLPLQLCLIESRLPERQDGQISTLLHKFSSLALVTMVAMVVKHTTLLSGCTQTRLLMRPAQSIELVDTIMVLNALNKLSVRTAHQLKAAGTKTTTRSTTPMSMVRSVVKKR